MNGEIFFTLQEAKVVVENWRRENNQVRPPKATKAMIGLT